MPSARPAPRAPSRTFAQLLRAYPLAVRGLARQTRQVVLNLVPNAEQTVDSKGPYVSYGFGQGHKGIVCTISVSQTGVKLALAHGATLPDPTGLLEGSGRVHRHIVIKAADDLHQPGVRALVTAAFEAWRKRR